MTAFRHILVPTDFGEAARHALDLALEVASMFGASITLLHVGWVPPAEYERSPFRWPTDELALAARRELDGVLASAKVKAGYSNIEALLVSGVPWQQILSAVKDHDADLIVMGTNGHRSMSQLLLGSVAEKIVRLSPVPVLTVGLPPTAKI
jgi:nucleotide-binding universal stress UspA family protein